MTYIPRSELPLTEFGDLRTAELHPKLQQSFEYTVDNTDLNENAVVAGGTVTQADGMGIVSTSTTTGSSAILKSRRHAKYSAGLGSLMRFTALFTSPVAGTDQLAGFADEVGSGANFKNGYMVGYVGTVFGFHRFQNDTLITVAQSAWDDPMDGTGPSGMTLDQTKLNVYEIGFQYLGAGKIELLIEDDATGDFVVVHRILYANNNTVPSVYNPNFHAAYYVDNHATTSNVVLKTASYAYFVEGGGTNSIVFRPQFSTGEQETTGVTTEVAIVTIRNKATYASKTNFIDILMELTSVSIEANTANNLGNVRFVRNATLGGTPSYTDINTTDSVVDYDVAGTTVTGGIELFNISLAGKNDKEVLPLVPLELVLEAGETLTIAGSSSNSATIRGSILWKELI